MAREKKQPVYMNIGKITTSQELVFALETARDIEQLPPPDLLNKNAAHIFNNLKNFFAPLRLSKLLFCTVFCSVTLKMNNDVLPRQIKTAAKPRKKTPENSQATASSTRASLQKKSLRGNSARAASARRKNTALAPLPPASALDPLPTTYEHNVLRVPGEHNGLLTRTLNNVSAVRQKITKRVSESPFKRVIHALKRLYTESTSSKLVSAATVTSVSYILGAYAAHGVLDTLPMFNQNMKSDQNAMQTVGKLEDVQTLMSDLGTVKPPSETSTALIHTLIKPNQLLKLTMIGTVWPFFIIFGLMLCYFLERCIKANQRDENVLLCAVRNASEYMLTHIQRIADLISPGNFFSIPKAKKLLNAVHGRTVVSLNQTLLPFGTTNDENAVFSPFGKLVFTSQFTHFYIVNIPPHISNTFTSVMRNMQRMCDPGRADEHTFMLLITNGFGGTRHFSSRPALIQNESTNHHITPVSPNHSEQSLADDSLGLAELFRTDDDHPASHPRTSGSYGNDFTSSSSRESNSVLFPRHSNQEHDPALQYIDPVADVRRIIPNSTEIKSGNYSMRCSPCFRSIIILLALMGLLILGYTQLPQIPMLTPLDSGPKFFEVQLNRIGSSNTTYKPINAYFEANGTNCSMFNEINTKFGPDSATMFTTTNAAFEKLIGSNASIKLTGDNDNIRVRFASSNSESAPPIHKSDDSYKCTFTTDNVLTCPKITTAPKATEQNATSNSETKGETAVNGTMPHNGTGDNDNIGVRFASSNSESAPPILKSDDSYKCTFTTDNVLICPKITTAPKATEQNATSNSETNGETAVNGTMPHNGTILYANETATVVNQTMINAAGFATQVFSLGFYSVLNMLERTVDHDFNDMRYVNGGAANQHVNTRSAKVRVGGTKIRKSRKGYASDTAQRRKRALRGTSKLPKKRPV